MGEKRICVVGLGTMGSQIALVFARAGLETMVVEADQARLDQGMDRVRGFLDRQVKMDKLFSKHFLRAALSSSMAVK